MTDILHESPSSEGAFAGFDGFAIEFECFIERSGCFGEDDIGISTIGGNRQRFRG
jgi:hypothetical protein